MNIREDAYFHLLLQLSRHPITALRALARYGAYPAPAMLSMGELSARSYAVANATSSGALSHQWIGLGRSTVLFGRRYQKSSFITPMMRDSKKARKPASTWSGTMRMRPIITL